MTSLEIAGYLIFRNCDAAAEGHNQEKQDIWKLMPPNAKTLEVYFEGEQGLFGFLCQPVNEITEGKDSFLCYW
ncbi:hypothetical protein LTR64_002202 [Lithohypha guttulata]|uniref:Uncharacterized protein n=1 Tax=Lithohypha guttulata TaxID=1690604 RepID=A0AAN7STE4_9EURO|nr:hypothetical protein LTR51_001572 [Lithohypha guttulata]KAK5080987.1 hypothetical protein LTR05_008304 [Lithohypha guttulata]